MCVRLATSSNENGQVVRLAEIDKQAAVNNALRVIILCCVLLLIVCA